METLEIYLTPLNAQQFKAIVTKSPVGEGETESSLPFFAGEIDWRMTLLRTLEMSAFNSKYFHPGEQEWMLKSGIISEDMSAFHPHYIANIGQELYKSLFPLGSKIEKALLAAQRVAESENKQLHLRLTFEADVVQRSRLTDYPWELLHDGEKFLLHKQLTISRYIAHNSVPPNLARIQKLNVLLISSPASDSELGLQPFESREQKAIRKGLKIAQEAGSINFSQLDDATVDNLRKYLTETPEENTPHVLHFDGHGLFGKRCSHCRAMNKGVKALTCRKCNSELPQAQGYLVFEDEDGEADYLSAEELGTLLRQSSLSDRTNKTGVTLTVLSACQSAMTFIGDSVFNGTAQNLISHRIPAVVAMQYSIGVEAAAKFAEQFYRSLGQRNSLAAAISQAREAMGVEGNQWYRPVLYLRWRDKEGNEGGQLFATPESATHLGIPFQAPPLPSSYVDRPEYSQDLKTRLFANSSTNTDTLVIHAIHGMGSVGKSTLVAAIARDPEVKKHFCDGILWVTLGQEPKVLELLGGWVQALGDYNHSATNVEVTSKHLGSLLQDKAMLLIIDDAWNTADVQPFKVGGSRCQLLVTTRESAIAKVLGASTYSLDVMKPEQAMELLTKLLGSMPDLERQEAAALAKAVGYLPLALELAAAQVKDGNRWAVLLQDLQQEVARLKTFDDPEAGEVSDEVSLKRLSLTASLNLSIQRLPEDNRLDFIWLGVLPEDVNITQMMTATFWDTDERDAFDRLRYLRSKALLLPGIPLADGTLTYKLHDLLHDLARNLLTASPTPKRKGNLPGLGLTLAAAHANFLQQYRQKTQKNLWHTLPHDGYIHQYLVWHLEKAQQVEEIHALLREESQTGSNGWYEAREKLGQTGGYITDISRAWELTETNWTESTLPEVVSLQCRYALITASVNSLVASVVVELLVALIKNNVWTPEQGLAYALQNPNPQQKVNNLKELLNYLPANLKELALQKALVAAREIQIESDRIDALNALAEKIPEVLPEALAAALAAARLYQDEHTRAHALIALADKLPEVLPEALATARAIQYQRNRADALIALTDKLPEVLPEALAAAVEMESESDRADALSALAKKLPLDLLPQALAAARAIHYENYRVNALSALAQKLPEVLPEALAAVKSIQYDGYRANALRVLADKLPPELLPEALAIAREIQTESDRANALTALADKLPPELLLEVIAAVREIEDESYRANALNGLADKLPPELLPQLLGVVREIQSEYYRVNALNLLAKKLPSELLPQFLAVVREIQSEYSRADALNALAEKLPPELLPEVLAAVREIQDESYRANALKFLAQKLPEVLPEALAVVRLIQDDSHRAYTLKVLAEKLPPELMPQALAAAKSIQDEYSRADTLKVLAEKLPQVFPQALAATREISDETYRGYALRDLAQILPPELMPQAFAAAVEIENDYCRAYALSALAKKLPPELLPKAFAAATASIKDESDRAHALIALAEKLPQVLPQALTLVKEIHNESDRADALSALAGQLVPQILPQALAAAREIQNESDRADALSALAKKLPLELLPEALAIAKEIPHDYDRTEALKVLAEKLPPELMPQALAIAKEIYSEGYRATALSALTKKLPPELLPQALTAAVEIGDESYRADALSALAKKLPPELIPQAFTAAVEIEDERYRADALSALAEKLPPELLPQALAVARKIQFESYRIDVLSALAEKLPPELTAEAIAIVKEIEDETYRTSALKVLVEKLPELLPQALAIAREIQDKYSRADALKVLAEKLPEVFPQALAAAREIKNEYNRAEILSDLAQILPLELLPQALAAAREIQEGSYRAHALSGLVEKLPEVFPQALAAARETESESDRDIALGTLAQKLPPALLPQALALVKEIQGESSRANVLKALAEKLPPELLTQALALVKEIQYEYYRIDALEVIVEKLPPDLLSQALTVAREIQDERSRADTLKDIAEKLPPELLSQALTVVWELENHEYRANVLSVLAQKLSPELLPQAIAAAVEIPYKFDRTNALSALASTLSQIPSTKLFPIWQHTLHILFPRTRPDLLIDIKALFPVIFALGGAAATAEVARAIVDVARWWR